MLTDTTSATADDKIRCDACPVMCYIRPGAAGACDRYANHNGELVRVDPHIVLQQTVSHGGRLVPFQAGGDWDGTIVHEPNVFVTAIGAGTTYPDYKPAPFIVSSEINGVDMVTVVTEGIFSYCGVKVKIDTDRYLGPETATVRAKGEAIGHVTTSEYGSQMLSLGGVHHLTGGSKKEGRVTCDALMDLSNCKPVELTIDGGATVVVQAGYPPIVNGIPEQRMRVGCGSATIGMFAKQWHGKVDEVVVVDDHITGVLSEHQAGKLLDIPDTGIKMKGRRSTPGRYFQVAEPGTGWGGTEISDPLSVLGPFDPKTARPGTTMLMVSTTGEHAAYFELDEALKPVAKPMPAELQLSVERIQENCEPALCTVLFMGGAGGSLAFRRHRQSGAPDAIGKGRADPCYQRRRAGLCLARRRHHLHGRCHATAGRRLRLCADAGAGGTDRIHLAAGGLCSTRRPHGSRSATVLAQRQYRDPPDARAAARPGAARMKRLPQIAWLADGMRLHLQDGPIDLIVEAKGSASEVVSAYQAAVRRFTGLLDELCDELPLLRQVADPSPCLLHGVVARRMHAAVAPFAAENFITPMAAVAGAVAEEILGAMVGAAELERAYVNNGGDIALHLADGEHFTVGLMDRPDAPSLMQTMVIQAGDPARGVATSGRHGRSFSLGIADAVTVLARTASQADAAATIIANAVDLPGHPAIVRRPARDLQPDSDLGARLVTRGVGELSEAEIAEALEAGAACARKLLAVGLIEGAALRLHGETVVVAAKIVETRSQMRVHTGAVQGTIYA